MTPDATHRSLRIRPCARERSSPYRVPVATRMAGGARRRCWPSCWWPRPRARRPRPDRPSSARPPRAHGRPTDRHRSPAPRPLDVAGRAAGGSSAAARGAARLRAPARPAGRSWRSIRRPASDTAHRVGALVVNPGGPGASGIGIVRGGFGVDAGLGRDWRDRFDIVSWDTRGTGASQPLACGVGTRTAFLDLSTRSRPTPPRRRARRRAQRRRARTAPRTPGRCSTTSTPTTTARDLEQLRRALGGAKLNYAGYSLRHGHRAGATRARYPTHIRAMVLDGVVDPDRGPAAPAHRAGRRDGRSRSSASSTPAATGRQLSADRSVGHLRPAGRGSSSAPPRAGSDRPRIGPSDLATAAIQSTYDPDLGPVVPDRARPGGRGRRQPDRGVRRVVPRRGHELRRLRRR